MGEMEGKIKMKAQGETWKIDSDYAGAGAQSGKGFFLCFANEIAEKQNEQIWKNED